VFTLEPVIDCMIELTSELVEVVLVLVFESWLVDRLSPVSAPAATPPRPASSSRTGSAEAGAAAARASRRPGRAR
jgi:hypothetical protein